MVRLYEGGAIKVIAASLVVIICRPVNEEYGEFGVVFSRINLPAALGGLQACPAPAHIPVLRERENLVGSNRRIPDVQVAIPTQVIDILIGMRPAMRRGYCGSGGLRQHRGRVALRLGRTAFPMWA